MAERQRLSADLARRVALTAQGFHRPRPKRPTRGDLRAVFDSIGVVQIDTVNVFARAHEMTVFSRLGPYPQSWLYDAVADGELFEYWAHGTCFIPTEHQRWHRWRQAVYRDTPHPASIRQRKPDVVAGLLDQVKRRGPLAIGDVQGRVRKRNSEWWDWDDAKTSLEALFQGGEVAVTRKPDFGKLYDLADRVLPASALAMPTPTEHESRRWLVMEAARALGVATVPELAFYHYQRTPRVRAAVGELVEAGELLRADVEGWDKPAFVHPGVLEATPNRVKGRALISPFDPMMWSRQRIARLFMFDYVLEIYFPAAKRTWGYYVLPLLLDGHLAARVDLKADRQQATLRVQSAWIEPDLDNPQDRAEVAQALVAELADLATWLQLDTIAVTNRGNLTSTLRTLPTVTALDD